MTVILLHLTFHRAQAGWLSPFSFFSQSQTSRSVSPRFSATFPVFCPVTAAPRICHRAAVRAPAACNTTPRTDAAHTDARCNMNACHQRNGHNMYGLDEYICMCIYVYIYTHARDSHSPSWAGARWSAAVGRTFGSRSPVLRAKRRTRSHRRAPPCLCTLGRFYSLWAVCWLQRPTWRDRFLGKV